jgi:hypothetical protein
MDALVIIVVIFIKKLHVSENSLTALQAWSSDFLVSVVVPPNDSVQVIITPEAVTVEKERV